MPDSPKNPHVAPRARVQKLHIFVGSCICTAPTELLQHATAEHSRAALLVTVVANLDSQVRIRAAAWCLVPPISVKELDTLFVTFALMDNTLTLFYPTVFEGTLLFIARSAVFSHLVA